MDEIKLVAELFGGVPTTPDLTAPRAKLAARITRGRKPRFARYGLLAAAAAVAAVSVLAVQGANAPPASARDVLLRAAETSAGTTPIQVRPGQFVHTVSRTKGRATGMKDNEAWIFTSNEERWLPTKISPNWMTREQSLAPEPLPGKPLPAAAADLTGTADTVYESCTTGSDADLEYTKLASWPTDVDKLREQIGHDGDKAWQRLTELSQQSALRPDLQSAVFKVAADFKGVKLVRNATDAAGRPAVGVARDSDPGWQDVLLFGRDDYRYLGSQTVSTRTVESTVEKVKVEQPPGTILTATALMRIEVVDAMPKAASNASRIKLPC